MNLLSIYSRKLKHMYVAKIPYARMCLSESRYKNTEYYSVFLSELQNYGCFLFSPFSLTLGN